MTARISQWNPFRRALPQQSTSLPWDKTRMNLLALSATAAASIAPGWSYTNSVTRGESSPGLPSIPNRKYWYYGTGNSRIWIKAVCSYTGTDVTKIALYYSEDNEATYVPMIDESDAQNYVLTLTYDGGSNLTETTWGNTP